MIVTSGPQPVRALLAANTKTPIVFAILADPISDGFVQSLARPGGNITGLSMSGTDLESKRLEVLKNAVPTISKVMVLHDPSMGATGLSEVKTGARFLGLELFVVEASDEAKFTETFAGVAAQGINGMATMASPFLNFRRKRLIELAAQYHLPSIWENSAYVRDGGMLSCWSKAFLVYVSPRRGYAWPRLLGGRKPADLPVELPIKFELAVQCANRQDRPDARNPIDATDARR